MQRKSGTIKRLESTEYFIPFPLPPANPPFVISSEIDQLQTITLQTLQQLNEIAHLIPSVQRFVKSYVIKEAQLSSSIEGIHTTLLDVFTKPLFETQLDKQTQLVLNYYQATQTAVQMIKIQNLPLMNRVINQAHETLLQGGSQEKASPGQYRKQAVKVENLTPAPAFDVPECMSELEKYINHDDNLGPLIQTGLVHVQFETIHPFLDGNGRIGRMLIVLMLLDKNLLSVPLLYPSYYFKKYHHEYYDKLDIVRRDGNYEAWILFYLKVMHESCQDAHARALKIYALHTSMIQKIKQSDMRPAQQEQMLLLLDYLFEYPAVSIASVAKHLQKTYNTAKELLDRAKNLKIVRLAKEQTRNKVFVCFDYIDILDK
ncbi:Fic family protein [Candidatus Babeliales bacterium]|nr:Fic family protein [Candidatus Babeliales bacterium]